MQEANGKWALPGGWCDVDQSVAENTLKEAKEEAGLDVELERVIAIQDRENTINQFLLTRFVRFFHYAMPKVGILQRI